MAVSTRFFISPPMKQPLPMKTSKAVEEIPKLILAPFNTTPEVKFGEVSVNAECSRALLIYNPSNMYFNAYFGNIEPDDRIYTSEPEFILSPHEEKLINLIWCPIHSGYLRKTVRICDATRSARKFDLVLRGMAANTNKPVETKKLKPSNSVMSAVIRQPSQKESLDSIRRQTYTIINKENVAPLHFNSTLRASSPVLHRKEFSHSSTFSDNALSSNFSVPSASSDSVDVPMKYSKFESELTYGVDFLNESNPLMINRNTFMRLVDSEVVNKTFLLQKFDSLQDGAKLDEADRFPDSLEELTLNVDKTFDVNADQNVQLTPVKTTWESLLSPMSKLGGFNSSISKSVGHLHCIDETPVTKNEQFFISPPTRSSKCYHKSPENIFRHRTGSSAISDRKKHIRTSFLSGKRISPKSASKLRENISTIEKVRTRNPQSFKQAFSSHCSIGDPFLKQVLYNEDGWAEQQERNIIKWINSVLAPPINLTEEHHDMTIDVVDLGMKKPCQEESMSISKMPPLYPVSESLDTLRKRRKSLMLNEPIRTVFNNLHNTINRKIISVRDDRDLHADEGLRKKVLELLSCYNSQWLRMGLEAVYDQEIALQRKADIGGLGLFLRKNLLAKNPIHNRSITHKDNIKKDILLKILKLIYFMDQARIQKLMRHTPCLFVLNSRYKSSQEILTAFCADLVIGRGYVMKHLKDIGYNLRFKQTCVNEYDYTIKSFDDLNDGVRLARLFEILFMETNLCSELRVPAVDIENKKHNVEIAMRAAKSRCQIEGNIMAEDIVLANRVGSRMKTLSFLWQIIHNYLTPLYERATMRIQKWWRAKRLIYTVKKFVDQRKRESAVRIQSLWRGYVTRQQYGPLLKETRIRNEAAIKIQSLFKTWLAMRHDRKVYQETIKAVLLAQRLYRCRLGRRRFLELKTYAVFVQRSFRACRETRQRRKDFLKLRSATIYIQRLWRANLALKTTKIHYNKLRQATISVQRAYRSKKLTESLRMWYENLKSATVRIQRRFRANQAMEVQQKKYQSLNSNVIVVQRRYRALKLMKTERNYYLTLREVVIKIQQRYRANRATRIEQTKYENIRKITIMIQRKFRANREMKEQQSSYENLKWSVLVLQKRYRAFKAMQKERERYLALQLNVVTFQRRYRANKATRLDHTEYEKIREATMMIQRQFRAKQAMRKQRNSYLSLKLNVVIVQRKYRALKAMQIKRKHFLMLRRTIVILQRRYRTNKTTLIERKEYENIKRAIISIQRWYRFIMLTKKQQLEFRKLKCMTIKIQQWYRAKKLTIINKSRFQKIESAALVIQRRYRARRTMQECRLYFLKLKTVVIAIQRRFVAWRQLKSSKLYDRSSRHTAINQLAMLKGIELRGKNDGFQDMLRCRLDFLRLKMATIYVQRRFIANFEKKQYVQLKKYIVLIQKIWRRRLVCKQMLEQEKRLKDRSASKIQAFWRGYITRKKYVLPVKQSIPLKQGNKENMESKGTLSERYKKAIYVLKTSDEYDKITIALWNLETVTTFSAKLCEGVTEEGVVHIIFDLISRANRSVPSMELYRAGFSVLINLARYPPTKIALWQNIIKEEYVLQILRIMKMNFDKVLQKTESEVFLYSATFLWLLCHDSHVAAEIVNIDTIAQQIQKMLDILKTKCPCSKKRKKKPVYVTPETITDWYADRTTRTFNDHCFAMRNVHLYLFRNRSAANII